VCDALCGSISIPIITAAIYGSTTVTEETGSVAGMLDSGSEAFTPLTSHTTARPRQAGASFESQTMKRPAAYVRAKPIGASHRYGPTHFHPGQIRNA